MRLLRQSLRQRGTETGRQRLLPLCQRGGRCPLHGVRTVRTPLSARGDLAETGEYEETENRRARPGNRSRACFRCRRDHVAVECIRPRGRRPGKYRILAGIGIAAIGTAVFRTLPAGDIDTSEVGCLPAGGQRKIPAAAAAGFLCKRRMYGAAGGRDMCRTHSHGRYAGPTTYKMRKTAGYCIVPSEKWGAIATELPQHVTDGISMEDRTRSGVRPDRT